MMSAGLKRPSSSIRGFPRSSYSRYRLRQRNSEEEIVVFNEEDDLNACVKDVLVHIIKQDGVNQARRLAYLNALVKLCKRINGAQNIIYSSEEIIYCLRSALLSKHAVIRAAALRGLRHFIDSADKVHLIFQLKVDWCLARCLDLNYGYELERNQAVRLCRHLLQLHPYAIKASIVYPFIAIANDGVLSSDKMVLASLEYLCELAYYNSCLFSECGATQVLMQHIIICHNNSVVNESLIQTLLYLMNSPDTRENCIPQCGIEQLIGPFTDSHYKHRNDAVDSNAKKDDRNSRCLACCQALQVAFHSWPGLISLGNPAGSGIASLLTSLNMSSTETQKVLLQFLFNVFLLKVPKWTDKFDEALLSCDPSTPDGTWKLREGFVAAEIHSLYKANCKRPNLIDNHLALLLSLFITNGILEALCQVVIQAQCNNSIMATILLGELLYMSYLLLPWSDTEHTQYLPTLVAASSSASNSKEQNIQAKQAITYLDRIHSLKKKGVSPHSLQLELLLSFIPDLRSTSFKHLPASMKDKDKVDFVVTEESDEDMLEMLKQSNVLSEANSSSWNWSMIYSLLKANENSFKKLDSFTFNRFITKLLHFYSPVVENGFCTTKASHPDAKLFTKVGLLLIEKVLLINSDESIRHLKSYLYDLGLALSEIRQEMPAQEAKLGLSNIYNCCCQDYFLFIGKLSSSEPGLELLQSSRIMQQLLEIITITSDDSYVKLIISSLDYTKDGISRVILSKALTATSENARLYAADFMRGLLRISMPYFSSWCMELLTTQLYDQSRQVAMRSLSVIDEACEDQANLISLISLKPSILHLGQMGSLLLTRYLSVYEGFQFCSSSGHLDRELDVWHETYNEKYSDIVDVQLAESLTSYESNFDFVIQRRSSNQRPVGRSVYVPPHLYGQMVQHTEGTNIVANLPYLADYFHTVMHVASSACADVRKSKAAIWAMGHIGSSVFGLAILDKQEIIPALVHIAEAAKVLSLRGTAYFALGLIASTPPGVARLAECGWRSVMNRRSEDWPVLSEQIIYSDPEAAREIRSRSQGSTASQSSNKSDLSDMLLMFADEGARSRTSTDDLAESIQIKRNETLFENSTDDTQVEPLKDGKAHSTSELHKVRRGHHVRSSSDSFQNFKPQALPVLLVEDHSASRNVHKKEENQNEEEIENVQNSGNRHMKSSIKDSSRSILSNEISEEVMTKARSLSWDKNVHDNIQQTIRSDSIRSEASSADSALSKSPADSTLRVAVDLPATPSKTKPGYNRRFTSFQTGSLRGMYSARKDELGLEAVRAMRRQASTISAASDQLSPTSLPLTPKLKAAHSTNLIRPPSTHADLDKLQDVTSPKKIIPPMGSSAIRYMGVALPLDVISMFELDDSSTSNLLEKSTHAAADFKHLDKSSQDGLEMHSPDNCLVCCKLDSVVHAVPQFQGGNPLENPLLNDLDCKKNGEIDIMRLRKECLRLVTVICSSIGVNAAEEGLLRLRGKFPYLFQDLCLYSEICSIIATYSFHLPSRRFIQELFHDISFQQIFEDTEKVLKIEKDSICCPKHGESRSYIRDDHPN